MENRESFFTRIQPFFPPSTLRDIQLAYTLAKFSHRAQVRKELDEVGQPLRYFEHLRRVALVLIDEAKLLKPEMIISALLHDSLEDTRDITPDMLEHCFGSDVTTIVQLLSKVPKQGYLERLEMCSDWRPYVIKACDRLDNLRSLSSPDVTREFRIKQIHETQDHYYPLLQRMVSLTPSEHVYAAELLKKQIEKTVWEIKKSGLLL
jgi:(p)ppGpp synthase/HD superfamily hydrolase